MEGSRGQAASLNSCCPSALLGPWKYRSCCSEQGPAADYTKLLPNSSAVGESKAAHMPPSPEMSVRGRAC